MSPFPKASLAAQRPSQSPPDSRPAAILLRIRAGRGSEIHLVPVNGPFKPAVTLRGVDVAPVSDLVMMKLTSFRLKDKVHIQDMDAAGLITLEIEQSLSEPLRERLQEVRATR